MQLHEVLAAAVRQDAPAVVGGFGHVAQHVYGLFLVGHVRLLYQAGERLPGKYLVATPDYAPRNPHAAAVGDEIDDGARAAFDRGGAEFCFYCCHAYIIFKIGIGRIFRLCGP